MRAILAAVAIVAAVFAGCIGPDDAPPEDTTPASTGNRTIDIGERPNPTFTDIDAGPGAVADLNATLDAPPTLRVGEWWRIKFSSPLTGVETEFVRVVADIDENGNYVIGMPHEGWYKEAVVYHTPAFGDMNKDLSYDTHDVLFQPLKWPLTNEQTWDTKFSGGNTMTANVVVDNAEKTATVTFTSPNNGFFGSGVGGGGESTILTLVYDAKIHEVREFRHQTAVFEVMEHGYDFEGWVTVPRAEDLVFFHGRIGPALDIGLQPAGPTDTITLDGGYNRVTWIQVTQSIGAPGIGAYRLTTTAPDGTEYLTETLPGGPAKIEFFENAAPDGDWNMQYVSGGPGVVFIEGIAYHQYDIHLPDGRIRSDHSHSVIR